MTTANSTLEPGYMQSKPESSVLQHAPRLSRATLTIMLTLMCLVPGVVITALWYIMPPVKEGELKTTVTRIDVPEDIAYYLEPVGEREDVSQARLAIKNESDTDWSHIVIKVNHHYDIKDPGPIPPGGERSYLLSRFISRTGARFDLRQLPLRHIRIFAKQVDRGNRASLDIHYPEMIADR